MIYNDFQDIKISSLAMGAMRLPKLSDDEADINEPAVREMVKYAIEKGVNYFDTAWGYHNGHSELVMGRTLKEYPRESFYLADKFPGYDLANMGKVQEIFEKQLEKCQVDYFDFYLFHNVCEMNIDAYLDRSYGIYDYLTEQKRNGRIRHLGFSVHGDQNTLERFLDAYGKDMEFCQVQLNYVDWDFQAAKDKVALLKEWGIPVWVMEPVRGGRLANLSDEHTARLKELRADETPAAWAFRFLQAIPEVTVTLSGMSNFEQLKQNIQTFEEFKPVSERERDVLFEIAKDMTAKTALPCTECRYCVSHCPQGLDIPLLISLYNEHSFTNGGFIAPMRIGQMSEDKRPSACVGCRSCEAVCPQKIKISEAFSDFNGKL